MPFLHAGHILFPGTTCNPNIAISFTISIEITLNPPNIRILQQRQTAHCVMSRFAPPLMFSLAAKLLSVRVDIFSATIRF